MCRIFCFLFFLSVFTQLELRAQSLIVTDDITANTTWTTGRTYFLNGLIFVNSGATLTIEAGAVIKGRIQENITSGDGASALIVRRGAKINALGYSGNPVIFTSELDDLNRTSDLSRRDRGLWGGVIILGAATTNQPTTDNQIEGIPNTENALYGGTDDEDNSGILRYVSIRHGGFSISGVEGDEINGLTLGAVGSGTTIEFVEVYANFDDCFEWFGGTVNTKYLVGAFCGDDTFDYDQGFRGLGQFWFSIHDDDTAGRGGEHDGGDDGGDGAMPFSTPVISNVTYIGSGQNAVVAGGDNNDRTFAIRDNAGGQYWNSVFTDYPGVALNIEDLAGDDVDSRGRLEAGDLAFANNLWFGYGAGNTFNEIVDGDFADPIIQASNFFRNPELLSISRSSDANLNPKPTMGSFAATMGISDGLPTELESVVFLGSFDPSKPLWTDGWTALNALGFTSDLEIEAIDIEPIPNLEIPIGDSIEYQVIGNANPRLVFELESPPDGMEIGATSGLLTWRPSNQGDFLITVLAKNGIDVERVQFNISVRSVAPPPPPALTAPPDNSYLPISDVALNWQQVSSATDYELEISLDPEFDLIVSRCSHLTGNINSFSCPNLGFYTRYYWKVRAINSAGPGEYSDSRSYVLYPPSLELNKSLSFGPISQTTSWRMVGLPGEANILLSETFPDGTTTADWRAFDDEGTGDLVPYENGFRFEEGRGVWILGKSNSPWSVRMAVSSLVPNSVGAVGIDLDNEWNIITNPYELDVDWALVDAINGGGLQTPQAYRGSSDYEDCTTLVPYEGCYFFNPNNQLDSLFIPLPVQNEQASASKERLLPEQLISLRFVQDDAFANVAIGIDDSANEVLDNFDQYAPPGNFAILDARLIHHGLSTQYKELKQDVRPRGGVKPYFLEVRSNNDKAVKLFIEMSNEWVNTEIQLVDERTSAEHTLRNGSSIEIWPGSFGSRYLVYIRNSEAGINQDVAKHNVPQLALYPNPVRNKVTARYWVEDPGRVTLNVYDMLGRKVATLVDQQQNSGFHEIQWTPNELHSVELSSGTYIFRIEFRK